MPKKDTNDELDFLLAQGRMPGPVKERILQRAMDAAVPKKPPSWLVRMRFALATLGAAAALAVGLLMVTPRTQEDGFKAKGSGKEAGGALSLECLGARLNACPQGATLMFVVGATPVAGFLVAYAEPEAGGERIWYFSKEDGSPAVPALQTLPLRQGIRIGPEHAPGRYRVHLVVASRALSRQERLQAKPELFKEAAVTVLTVVR